MVDFCDRTVLMYRDSCFRATERELASGSQKFHTRLVFFLEETNTDAVEQVAC